MTKVRHTLPDIDTPLRKRFIAGFLSAALGLAACTPTVEVRGYVPDQETIDRLKTGIDNRRKVVRLVGSPSNVSTFEAGTWYYLLKKTEHRAFFEEKILDQQVVAIDFDDNGVVKDIRRFTLADARNIEPEERKTASRGRELGLLEQLFGNIGRFTGDSPSGGGVLNPGQ